MREVKICRLVNKLTCLLNQKLSSFEVSLISADYCNCNENQLQFDKTVIMIATKLASKNMFVQDKKKLHT